jgi:hypothetical protein
LGWVWECTPEFAVTQEEEVEGLQLEASSGTRMRSYLKNKFLKAKEPEVWLKW